MAGNWTKTPNEILEAMPGMGEAELKLTAVLVRETYGRHKTEVKMTYEDMQEKAKLSAGGVSNAIEAINKRGFFIRGNKSKWQVRILYTVEKTASEDSLHSRENSIEDSLHSRENSIEDSLPSREPSYKEKKEEEKESEPTPSPIKTLAAAFVEKTGIFASMGAWEGDWQSPLAVILKNSGGDVGTAVSKIEAAVDLARQRGYTIKSPMSITTIVANMNGVNGSHSGVLKVDSR